MYTVDEKNYLSSCLGLKREYVDSFLDEDIDVSVQVSKAANNKRLRRYLERKIKTCLSKTNSDFRDAFLIFYLSEDVEEGDIAEYTVQSTVVKMGKSGRKVLEIMKEEDFVRWSKNSEVLNRFLAFS